MIALVTPPMAQLLVDYSKAVMHIASDDRDRLRFWSRIIGKDILKSLRGVALRRGADYRQSVAAIAAQALAYFPEYEETITLLYQCYSAPTADRATLLHAFTEAAHLPS